jgi:predicted AAA+ superfamily ATPase
MEMEENFLQSKENLELRLLYGGYPQVITASGSKERTNILTSVRDGYLLKDILELDNQKDSLFVFNLLRLIAFQIGNDISFSELASKLNVNKKTVMRYLELLEKCYVIFSLHGFSRNLRNEYTKSPRYYFWDNGIRNVLISNFNSLNLRDDIGKLWENYCISERLKKNHYRQQMVNHYFWRTYDQKEIDLIEESGGKLTGFEFKWAESKTKTPQQFLDAYDQSEFKVINRDNYLDFIL